MTSSCCAAAARGTASTSARSAAINRTMRRAITSASGRGCDRGSWQVSGPNVLASWEIERLAASRSATVGTTLPRRLLVARTTNRPVADRRDEDGALTLIGSSRSSALGDFLELQLIQHGLGVRVAPRERLREL